MKKIFVLITAAATLVACGGGNKYYCQSDATRTYNDESAEFDTLSYALGMNLGLNVNVQQADFNLDSDVVYEGIVSELSKESVDFEFIEANRKNMERFTSDKVRPYMMIKRGFMTDRPDTLPLPALYDDQYNAKDVAMWMGYDMGNYVRTIMAPVNLYWVGRAIKDTRGVKTRMDIDSVMMLTQQQMSEAMSNYVNNDMPARSLELSKGWINEVAARDGIEMLVVDKDTMYYRIENAGGELKPVSTRDTVTFKFEAYTRRGSLIESTAKRAESVVEQAEKIMGDTSKMDDVTLRLNEYLKSNAKIQGVDERAQRILAQVAELETDTVMNKDPRVRRLCKTAQQYESIKTPTIPLGQFRIPGAIEGMKLVGVGGKVTLWMPATLAYGVRGNRQTLPNEAIVISIDLVDVKPSPIPAPGESQVKLIPAGNNLPSKSAASTPDMGKKLAIPMNVKPATDKK